MNWSQKFDYTPTHARWRTILSKLTLEHSANYGLNQSIN
jgi:hypothetical protein